MSDEIFFQDFEIVPLLAAMDLDKKRLIDVVRFAESERALCTRNDANGYAAMTVYDKAARGLRETFCGSCWERDETDNQAGIRHPGKKLRIVPCNFDENTANFRAQPTNRSPKGEVSRAKARCNSTGWLPGLPDVQPQEASEYKTWILGIFAVDGASPKAELSLPIAFDGSRYTRFAQRVILLTGDDDGGSHGSRRDNNAPTEIVDITITRK